MKELYYNNIGNIRKRYSNNFGIQMLKIWESIFLSNYFENSVLAVRRIFSKLFIWNKKAKKNKSL